MRGREDGREGDGREKGKRGGRRMEDGKEGGGREMKTEE